MRRRRHVHLRNVRRWRRRRDVCAHRERARPSRGGGPGPRSDDHERVRDRLRDGPPHLGRRADGLRRGRRRGPPRGHRPSAPAGRCSIADSDDQQPRNDPTGRRVRVDGHRRIRRRRRARLQRRHSGHTDPAESARGGLHGRHRVDSRRRQHLRAFDLPILLAAGWPSGAKVAPKVA